MQSAAERVVLEKSGQVRDLSGALIGAHDADADAKEFRDLYRYVGDVSRGRVVTTMRDVAQASDDIRTLATPQGELGQRDAQTQGTAATYVAGALECIADAACPVALVSKTYGTALYEDVANDLAQQVLPQSAGTGTPPELNPKLASTAYDATSDLALSVSIATETLLNSDIDLTKTAIRRLVNAFKLDREIRIANLLTTAANWPAAQTTATATNWSTIATATPLADVFTALAKSIIHPSHLVFTEAASQFFFANTSVYQYITAGELAEGTNPMPKVLIAKLRKLVGGVAKYVWGNAGAANAVLIYAPDDQDCVATARTFRYIGDAPDKQAAVESNGYLLRSFFQIKRGAAGHRSLVLVSNDDDKILSGALGGIITGVA